MFSSGLLGPTSLSRSPRPIEHVFVLVEDLLMRLVANFPLIDLLHAERTSSSNDTPTQGGGEVVTATHSQTCSHGPRIIGIISAGMEALAARDALGLDHWSHSVAPSTHTVPSGAMEVDVTLLSGRPLGALVDAPLLAILNPIPGAVTDDDMEEFASALRFNRISGFAEIEQTFTRAETIWYIVLDRCLQLRVKWFALTNGAQWCFGVFGKGYRAGYVFPPISHCVNRSIIPQYLALWSKSAIRDGWLDPDLFNLRPIELATSNERDEISNGVWRGPYSRETSPEADPDELRARILQDSSRPEMQAWLKEATEIQVQHVDLKGRGVVQTNSQDSRFAPTEIQMPQASILAGSADGHGRRGCRHESDRLKCYDRILDGEGD